MADGERDKAGDDAEEQSVKDPVSERAIGCSHGGGGILLGAAESGFHLNPDTLMKGRYPSRYPPA